MLDWNPLPQGSSVGGQCVFNLASSEWPQHMRKSLLAKQMLEKFQKKKDELVGQPTPVAPNEMHANRANSVPDPGMETTNNQATLQFLDQVLAGHNSDEVLEDN